MTSCTRQDKYLDGRREKEEGRERMRKRCVWAFNYFIAMWLVGHRPEGLAEAMEEQNLV